MSTQIDKECKVGESYWGKKVLIVHNCLCQLARATQKNRARDYFGWCAAHRRAHSLPPWRLSPQPNLCSNSSASVYSSRLCRVSSSFCLNRQLEKEKKRSETERMKEKEQGRERETEGERCPDGSWIFKSISEYTCYYSFQLQTNTHTGRRPYTKA